MALLKISNRVIEYSFYILFLLVPLAFTSATSELFELNKMWLTWGITIIIGAAWLTKMIRQRRILLCRTPLDIPIVLFLLSQIISTIFSLDPHVSLWGYYSRFNGGLLSIVSYVFLYYAFLSNLSSLGNLGYLRRLLLISLISGLIVALWGFPSHFGYDPTCFIFRGTFDVSCWTADFIPTIRIFSTLGQPNWLAAYLAILIPIAIAFALGKWKMENGRWKIWLYPSLIALFYVDVLYTRARSGILGVWISLIFFASFYYWINGKPKISISKEKLKSPIAMLIFALLIITFVIGTPFNQLNKFTLSGIGSYFQKPATTATTETSPQMRDPDASGLKQTETQNINVGGTESGDIRLLNVWKGAINAWKANPIFGTGVETFAFAYYKHKPAEHNLTSEWNFLYNKAHNEYLNYLATTGIFGIGTYLIMIITFLWLSLAKITNSFAKFANRLASIREKQEFKSPQNNVLVLALLSGYVSILVTNFFGFSVVITNIYLFMIPAFVFVLTGMIKPTSMQSTEKSAQTQQLNIYQWLFISIIILAALFMILNLFRFWRADIAYALGYNLDRAGEYENAYPSLQKAVKLRGDELVFKDELSINDAIIAAGLLAQEPPQDQKERTIAVANTLLEEAINTSNEIISKAPNNAVFWKTRTRVFYTLSQVDSRYLPKAMEAIEKASHLAPNDANILYNLGVLHGQNNNIQKGIEALEKTVKLKPDYRDARFGLGLYYHTASLDSTGKVVIDSALQKKAIAQMQYILDNINPEDKEAKESITNWIK